MPQRTASPAPFVPLRLDGRPLALKVALVLFGTLFLAASSYIEVPMVPVPVTMQTYAVLMVGALAGWRVGAITVLAWLAEGLAGLPVLAGGAGGIAYFMGPTGGYLIGFPLVAAFAGWLAERGWTQRVVPGFFGLLLAQAICFVPGALWLATFTGLEKAIALGVTPFLVGALLKSALAVSTLAVAKRALVRRGRRRRVTIRLRPHHLLCMLTYAGKGYSDAFCSNFDAIVTRLGSGEEILVVAGPDDVCAPVATLTGHHCHEASILDRDTAAAASVAALLGIPAVEGARFSLNAERLAALRSAFQVRAIRAACEDCEWSALCDAIADGGYPDTRLQA